MTLVDIDDEKILRRGEVLSHFTYEYNLANDIIIMPIVVDVNHFNRWVRASTFYNSVWNEGIEVYKEEATTLGAKELMAYRLSDTKEDLTDSECSFREKRYRNANNRADYEIFWGISACFAVEFEVFERHA